MPDLPGNFTLRTELRPGDLGAIVSLHGELYAREHGFDITFEAYVAGPLAEFVRSRPERGRIWLAEQDGRLVGCIAIVPMNAETAQLRWFLVAPPARGQGLGRRLLHEALAFCRDCAYRRVVLWTVSTLRAAARLYRAAGFRKCEERPVSIWGVDVIEECHELYLGEAPPAGFEPA